MFADSERHDDCSTTAREDRMKAISLCRAIYVCVVGLGPLVLMAFWLVRST